MNRRGLSRTRRYCPYVSRNRSVHSSRPHSHRSSRVSSSLNRSTPTSAMRSLTSRKKTWFRVPCPRLGATPTPRSTSSAGTRQVSRQRSAKGSLRRSRVSSATMGEPQHVRIDKWLWAARFFKTRSAATEAVVGGRVHVGGERVKPARDVHAGDTLEIGVDDRRYVVVVTGLAEKRGPASVAANLYAETPESIAAREQRSL